MKLSKRLRWLSIAGALFLFGCSGADSEPDAVVNAGNKITKQVPAIVLEDDQLQLDGSGNYLRENVAMTLTAVSGNFAGYVDQRLKVSADTTMEISLAGSDAITEMHIELLTAAPVISMDALISNADNLSSISQPELTSAGSRTLYFDDFSGAQSTVSMRFAQDVEIQEVQIRTGKHLVNQEFTENEVSIYAVRADDGTGSSISKNVYADKLTDGKFVAVDGRYAREKIKLTVEAVTGNLGGYAGSDLKINADTTALFYTDNEAQFYALELDIVVPSGETNVEELVTAPEGMLVSLFNTPDGQMQRLSLRSAQSGGAISSEITFLQDTVLKNGDLYGNELTVGF